MSSNEEPEAKGELGPTELKDTFTEEGLNNILGFLGCLKDIQDRLLREGYRIEGDEFIPPT